MGIDPGQGTLPPTLADVAERAGVSRQTVSNAINNPSLLRADTLDRVRRAIVDLGYLPNRAARNLRTGTSRLVGLRVPPVPESTANSTMDRFVHALVEASGLAGYHVLLVADGYTEAADGTRMPDPIKGYDDLLRSTAVDAFVVTDTYLGNPQTTWLAERRAPFVAFGRPWDDPAARHAWVDVDGAAGTRLATEHLMDRGHQRVAWLGWPAGSRIGQDRRTGWERAMLARRCDTGGLAWTTEDSLEPARRVAATMLDVARPSAVVCASDTLAMAVLHVLAERGLRPGHDLAVVGFDDSATAQTVPPGLTSVRPPMDRAAVAVVDALRGLLGAEQFTPTGVLLTPTLSVRGSTVPS
ncbi:LacI family transcriptional regulator [Nocardioides sp. GY 10113]|uniref:LacI family DNA-binding transcriptional regulator n=1 Tax=Nocardioides sp. GY 10113 TaxID=2569761 RepID=UPI0010A7A4C5|nr:LacI family DNA-binding transcriptional regulator [Nocardioides sp. GY 10113]TIC89234.1 LacI family transcriptional regulator [Nocardioides sp. GY 10113]